MRHGWMRLKVEVGFRMKVGYPGGFAILFCDRVRPSYCTTLLPSIYQDTLIIDDTLVFI